MLDKGKPEKGRKYDWGVRVNSVDSGFCKDDLRVLLAAKHLPDTISLPKVENVAQLHWVNAIVIIPVARSVFLVGG